MLYVPVVSSTGQPLMPCHPARARELVRAGRALRRFDHGLFYIRLLDRADGARQPVAVGIDTGSKKEGLTVKSAAHTYLNLQADAVTWVERAVAQRRQMRRARRFRRTPCRAPRFNRSGGGLPPSTRARWQWKLRLCRWLARRYPISRFVVEDITVPTRKGRGPEARHWNVNFSPLEVGKRWFYGALGQLAPVDIRPRDETTELWPLSGLQKTTDKKAEVFEAHCLDSWALANAHTGGHIIPDFTRLLLVTPLRFHRRQLHRLQAGPGGIRRPYGGTRSHGLKRGSLVRHPRYGVAYVGGSLRNHISLHSVATGERLTQRARPSDCRVLAYNSWRTRLLPMPEARGIRRANM